MNHIDPPLDLAAQAAAIFWVCLNHELPEAEAEPIRSAVRAALALGGIQRLDLLLERVERGESARGQVRARPQASLSEIQSVAAQLERLSHEWEWDVELLSPDEYTVDSLMADLPLLRSARNQLKIQLQVLADGIQLETVLTGSPTHLYTVGDFETLPIISTRLWGSPDYWPQIAALNQLQYPYTVVPGQVLRIPQLHVHL